MDRNQFKITILKVVHIQEWWLTSFGISTLQTVVTRPSIVISARTCSTESTSSSITVKMIRTARIDPAKNAMCLQKTRYYCSEHTHCYFTMRNTTTQLVIRHSNTWSNNCKTLVTYFARTVNMGVMKIFTYLSAKLYARFNLQNIHSIFFNQLYLHNLVNLNVNETVSNQI